MPPCGLPIRADSVRPFLFLSAALLLAVFLAIATPARVLPVLLPPSVSIEGLSGTLWRGHAARSVIQWQGQLLALGELNWQVNAWSLFTFKPEVTFESQWGAQSLAGSLRMTGADEFRLNDVNVSVPVDFVRKLLPFYIGGRFAAVLPELQWQGGTVGRAEGRIDWSGAVWKSAAGDVALGNYRLDLVPGDRAIVGEVSTLSGPLQITGELRLQDNRYKVDLALSGEATGNPGLVDALQLMASPVGDGYAIKLNGQL